MVKITFGRRNTAIGKEEGDDIRKMLEILMDWHAMGKRILHDAMRECHPILRPHLNAIVDAYTTQSEEIEKMLDLMKGINVPALKKDSVYFVEGTDTLQ